MYFYFLLSAVFNSEKERLEFIQLVKTKGTNLKYFVMIMSAKSSRSNSLKTLRNDVKILTSCSIRSVK